MSQTDVAVIGNDLAALALGSNLSALGISTTIISRDSYEAMKLNGHRHDHTTTSNTLPLLARAEQLHHLALRHVLSKEWRSFQIRCGYGWESVDVAMGVVDDARLVEVLLNRADNSHLRLEVGIAHRDTTMPNRIWISNELVRSASDLSRIAPEMSHSTSELSSIAREISHDYVSNTATNFVPDGKSKYVDASLVVDTTGHNLRCDVWRYSEGAVIRAKLDPYLQRSPILLDLSEPRAGHDWQDCLTTNRVLPLPHLGPDVWYIEESAFARARDNIKGAITGSNTNENKYDILTQLDIALSSRYDNESNHGIGSHVEVLRRFSTQAPLQFRTKHGNRTELCFGPNYFGANPLTGEYLTSTLAMANSFSKAIYKDSAIKASPHRSIEHHGQIQEMKSLLNSIKGYRRFRTNRKVMEMFSRTIVDLDRLQAMELFHSIFGLPSNRWQSLVNLELPTYKLVLAMAGLYPNFSPNLRRRLVANRKSQHE